MNDNDYLEYLKGIASKIEKSEIRPAFFGSALMLMAKPKYYAEKEGIGTGNGSGEKEVSKIPLIEIAKMYNLTIKGDELLIPKGGMGDDYKACLELLREHGYKYGGKGSYKFVKVY